MYCFCFFFSSSFFRFFFLSIFRDHELCKAMEKRIFRNLSKLSNGKIRRVSFPSIFRSYVYVGGVSIRQISMDLSKIVSRLRTWLHLRKMTLTAWNLFSHGIASTGEKLDHRFRLSEHNVSMLRKWKYVRCHFHRHLLAKKKADLSFPFLLFFFFSFLFCFLSYEREKKEKENLYGVKIFIAI